LADEIRYLATHIPDIHEMSLHYSTLGSSQQLKDDIVAKTINRVFLYDENVRSLMEYELRKSAGRHHRLLEAGREVAGIARRILSAYHQVALQLSAPAIPAFAPAIEDVKQQIIQLLPPLFLTNTPDRWLAEVPRFLKAIQLRLEKLSATGHS